MTETNGKLPPNKMPLNRKRFAMEVLKEFNSDGFNFSRYSQGFIHGFTAMTPCLHGGKIIFPVTAEQVGALKVIKIALNWVAYVDEKIANGETKTSLEEIYDTVIKPVIDL